MRLPHHVRCDLCRVHLVRRISWLARPRKPRRYPYPLLIIRSDCLACPLATITHLQERCLLHPLFSPSLHHGGPRVHYLQYWGTESTVEAVYSGQIPPLIRLHQSWRVLFNTSYGSVPSLGNLHLGAPAHVDFYCRHFISSGFHLAHIHKTSAKLK